MDFIYSLVVSNGVPIGNLTLPIINGLSVDGINSPPIKGISIEKLPFRYLNNILFLLKIQPLITLI